MYKMILKELKFRPKNLNKLYSSIIRWQKDSVLTNLLQGQHWFKESLLKNLPIGSKNGHCDGYSMTVIQKILEKKSEDINQLHLQIYLNSVSKEKKEEIKIILEKETNATIEEKYSNDEINQFFVEVDLLHQPNVYKPQFPELIKANNQQQSLSIVKILMSEQLKKEGGIEQVDIFSGAYTKEEVGIIYHALTKLNVSYPFTMVISNAFHTIALGKEGQKEPLLYADIEKSPIQYIEQPKEISECIRNAFEVEKNDDLTIITTKIFVTKQYADDFRKQLQNLKQTESWQESHAITKEKTTYINTRGESLPFLAVVDGNLELLKTLLDKGLDPNTKGENGMPLINIAAGYGNIEIVRLLWKNGANTDAILQCAIDSDAINKEEKITMVNWIINEKIVKVDVTFNSTTPLFYAIKNKNADIVKLLLNKGADPDKQKVYYEFEDITPKTMTTFPLKFAIDVGDAEIIDILLDNNADFTQKADRIPLVDYAKQNDRLEIAFLLQIHEELSTLDPDTERYKTLTKSKSELKTTSGEEFNKILSDALINENIESNLPLILK